MRSNQGVAHLGSSTINVGEWCLDVARMTAPKLALNIRVFVTVGSSRERDYKTATGCKNEKTEEREMIDGRWQALSVCVYVF